jgi:hypothetical protein
MNEVATQRNENLPVAAKSNPFLKAAAAIKTNSILGERLKFIKGDYIVEDKELAPGTEVIIHMDSLIQGYVKWEDELPVEEVMGLVVEGFEMPDRDSLGDTDETKWETKPGNKKPTDPWSLTHQVAFKNVETGELYTFAISSWGGKKCFEMLLKKYGGAMSQHEGEWPVAKLNFHVRDDDEYGRIKEPRFPIVRWVPQADFTIDDEEIEPAEAAPAAKKSAAAKPALASPATGTTKF